MKENSSLKGESPSDLIDAKIRELDDWRGSTLSRIRNFIKQVDPDVVEELKWRKPTNPAGVPVWSHDGLICTGETYKDHVKVTFADAIDPQETSGERDIRQRRRVRRFHSQSPIELTVRGTSRQVVEFETSIRPKRDDLLWQ